MENVIYNGSVSLNLHQYGYDNFDPEEICIDKDLSVWLKVNGEAVNASRPFEVFGENGIRNKRNNYNVCAILLK